MSPTYTITRSTEIAAQPAQIHPYLNDFRQWVHWSPWEGVDADLKREYSGADRGVGARYAWTGNRKAGAGSMEITADAAERVDVRLVFSRPMKATNDVVFTLVSSGAGTRVTWAMTGPHSLFSRVGSALGFFDRLLGKDFEKGLASLKNVVEAA
ncbi:SRPBCC family protein [Gordonia sp. TBRC 11910]|uniref:SRPBCC family protein n=1 Tax=Gordonia asplenii TaxID=2725283 RepID=A0A848KPA9_9ACTN|nr:SRPBCC family protein [Gordonia asplenii]NMO00506.1 SRPBCC family protein [Gordonia asplenii]